MPGLILAIDQGTTNTKALLVARDGQPVFRAIAPVTLHTPRPGFVEQDPTMLWNSVVDVIAQCIEHAGSSIEGISISNQRETAVAWYRHLGVPAANAISWQCRRSEDLCCRLSSYAEKIGEKTGLPLDPLITASKWAWLLDEEKSGLHLHAASGGLCLGTVDSWLVYKLTNGAVHATDHSNASRTALLNLSSLDWDDDLLALFAIQRAAMPRLLPSSGVFGTVRAIPELAGIPIVSVIGDSHAALAGHGSYRPGTVKATYGTGSSLMTLTPTIPGPAKNLARTIAWSTSDGAQYALEGNITMAGAAVQWVGEFLDLSNPTADAVALAESVPDSGGVYFVPAMVGLGAPHWDSAARGTLTGLSRTSTRAHMARAAVEAIAYQVADVFHAMQIAAGVPLPVLYVDGGATRNSSLMQFQADLLQLPVHRSACEDMSALGAAWLGGLALGWWKHIDDLQSLPQETQVFVPRAPVAARYEGWKHAVKQARLQRTAS